MHGLHNALHRVLCPRRPADGIMARTINNSAAVDHE